MIQYVKGDIFDLMHTMKADVFIHQANCGRVMGGGLARQVRDKLPQLYMADLQTGLWDKRKLGTISTATIDGVICINLYGQMAYSWNKKMTDERAQRKALRAIGVLYEGLTVIMPKIGCNVAGGTWEVTGAIVEEELQACNVIVVDNG